MKSYLRKSKASASTLRKIEAIVTRGWYKRPPRPEIRRGMKGGSRIVI